MCRTFMVSSGFVWEAYCGAFCQIRRDFCQRAVIFANAPQSLEKRHNPRVTALYKTAHFQEERQSAAHTEG